MGKPEKQLCTIRIMFPIDSDDEAIAFKKTFSEIVAEMSDVQIQFGLMTSPVVDPKG